MGDIFIYIILVVTAIAALIIKRDTKDLIARSDKLQKSLNAYIRREQRK
jgi:cell division protein FtsL